MSGNYGCPICEGSTGGASACPFHGQYVYPASQIPYVGPVTAVVGSPYERIAALERELAAKQSEVTRLNTEAGNLYDRKIETAQTLAAEQSRLMLCMEELNTERQRADFAGLGLAAEKSARKKAEVELDSYKGTMHRLWDRFGNPAYEELQGRDIVDLVAQVQTELAEEQKRFAFVVYDLSRAFPQIRRTNGNNGWEITKTADLLWDGNYEHDPIASYRAAIDQVRKRGL